ncbi:hypothetical protein ACVBEG_27160 [Pseudomonas sp. GG8]
MNPAVSVGVTGIVDLDTVSSSFAQTAHELDEKLMENLKGKRAGLPPDPTFSRAEILSRESRQGLELNLDHDVYGKDPR